MPRIGRAMSRKISVQWISLPISIAMANTTTEAMWRKRITGLVKRIKSLPI